jgi:hypothetical protein
MDNRQFNYITNMNGKKQKRRKKKKKRRKNPAKLEHL